MNKNTLRLNVECVDQAVTTCGSLAAGLQGNGERMRKWRENEEMERGDGERCLNKDIIFSVFIFAGRLNLRQFSLVSQKS